MASRDPLPRQLSSLADPPAMESGKAAGGTMRKATEQVSFALVLVADTLMSRIRALSTRLPLPRCTAVPTARSPLSHHTGEWLSPSGSSSPLHLLTTPQRRVRTATETRCTACTEEGLRFFRSRSFVRLHLASMRLSAAQALKEAAAKTNSAESLTASGST